MAAQKEMIRIHPFPPVLFPEKVSGILKRKKVSHKMKKFLIVLSLLGAMLVQAEDSEIWGALVGSSACQSYGSKAPA